MLINHLMFVFVIATDEPGMQQDACDEGGVCLLQLRGQPAAEVRTAAEDETQAEAELEGEEGSGDASLLEEQDEATPEEQQAQEERRRQEEADRQAALARRSATPPPVPTVTLA